MSGSQSVKALLLAVITCYVRVFTVSQKGCHQTRGGNFIKSQPIFKILLRLEREGYLVNILLLQQNSCIISHHTLSMLPHYLWEFKN